MTVRPPASVTGESGPLEAASATVLSLTTAVLSLVIVSTVSESVEPVRIDSCSLGRRTPLESGTKIRAVPLPENRKEKTFNSVLMMFGKLICRYVAEIRAVPAPVPENIKDDIYSSP